MNRFAPTFTFSYLFEISSSSVRSVVLAAAALNVEVILDCCFLRLKVVACEGYLAVQLLDAGTDL